jgi:hypothetical protein
MNIAYIKGDMIDYMDSPVPYIIGMSDKVWEEVGEKKWENMALEENDNIVLFRIDLENPALFFKSDQANEICKGIGSLTEMMVKTLNEVASRTVSSIYPSHEKLTDRETKIFVKQTVSNYLILLIQDVKSFKDEAGLFNYSAYS